MIHGSPEVEKGLNLLKQIVTKFQQNGVQNSILPLLKGIAPTICGVKAGELLTYPLKLQRQSPSCYKNWQSLAPLLKCYEDVDYIEITKSSGTKQIFLYHKACLQDTLKDEKIQDFLKEQGYPSSYQFETYLKTLVHRIEGRLFPHEIGIFLGYPLNDVKGFMGYTVGPIAYILGWQVYDPVEAIKVWEKHTFIRESIEKLSFNEVNYV